MRWALAVFLISTSALRAKPEPPPIPVTVLPVTPAASPVPALRWKLLPELRDTTPGNAAMQYYRAFSPEWTSQFQRNPQDNLDATSAALAMPLPELKSSWETTTGKLVWIRQSPMLKEIDRAARRQFCDWDMVTRLREDGIGMLLPDVQSFRWFARLLAVRARLELADGEFSQAIRSLQTGLALGRDVSDAPTLIQSLVGSAITFVMMDQVDEWIRTPNSPNLYWALTDLPRPLINLHKSMQGERIMLDSLFPGIRDALAARTAQPPGPAALADLQRNFVQLSDRGMSAAELALVTMKRYTGAKLYLDSQGWSPAVVESLPAIQVVLLEEVANYDRLYDDMSKWLGLPFAEARAGLQQAEQRLKNELVAGGDGRFSLAGLLLPAVFKVALSSERVERRIAALRVVEAIRMYAAETGRLPAKLTDITQVPVPVDPSTGAAFDYQSDGTTAKLTGPASYQPAQANNTIKYEITIRK